MQKYASLLAVSGGLALATTGCSEGPRESVCSAEYDAAEACSAFTCCSGCEGCEGCEGCAACEAIGGSACGSAECFAAACFAAACEASACNASGERADLGIEPYPQWPPEQPSWTTQIDYLIRSREGLSLYDAATRLRDALRAADYSAHSFYSVPGGFVLVTVTEQIDTEGYSMPGRFRYGAPGEGREDLLTRIRDLFLVRPEAYYRYVAIVVSNRNFSPGKGQLSAQEANRRVVQGSTDLARDARDIRFTDDFKVNALIYEYENPGIGIDLTPVEPRMLDARLHLERMGLVGTIQRAFEPGSD